MERKLRGLASLCAGIMGIFLVTGLDASRQEPASGAGQLTIYERMQQLLGVPHNSGQNVHPVFEGWERNPDGTANMWWGYMNRNWQEALDIPIGPNNRFAPGPQDRGQPTHFLPRRVKQLFKIVVPDEFDGEFVWTLSIRGKTEQVPGSLKPEQMIDVRRSSTDENRPPELTMGPDVTVPFPEPATLSLKVTDDTPPRRRGSSAYGLNVRWSKYRGPGRVVFGDPAPAVVDGTAVTTATVTELGVYTLAAFADDGSYYGTAQGQNIPGFACCWTFDFVTVTFK